MQNVAFGGYEVEEILARQKKSDFIVLPAL